MARFIGIKGNRISMVSDKPFQSDKLKIIELPLELHDIPANELLINYKIKDGFIVNKKAKILAKDMKIAFVTNFRYFCGLSTYAENLYPHIAKQVGDFKLFIEENDNPSGDIYQLGDHGLTEDQVSVCWKRGEKLTKLISELKSYNPDIILINFEYGLFPNAAHSLSMISQLSDFKIVTDMHSVFLHKDKTISEANLENVVVHVESARKVLKEDKKINAKVNVIPHGCYPYNPERLWNFYRTKHTFCQFGFLFPYKNFEHSLRAVHLLKDKYPDIFFTALCSEGPNSVLAHELYYRQLVDLAEELQILDNMAIIRGYQSEETLSSYLRTNAVSVFPYSQKKGHECHGASGACRFALSTGMPVITSSIPHFSDIPSMKADSPEEIAEKLDELFSSKEAVKNQIEKQRIFALETTFEKTAQQYIELFENI